MPKRPGVDAATISARLERLPLSRWHIRSIAIVGAAHLFDAFDTLTMAFVLPLLMLEWKLDPARAGLAISVGFMGQMLGAIAIGRAAERYGRVRVLRWTLTILSFFAFCSAFAQGIGMFLLLRFAQGIGLGGETPVAATYINELCPARLRGRIVFALQTIFAAGVLLTAVAAVWILPYYGWRGMFLAGSSPALLAVALPYLLSESPRWLVEQGRDVEASAIVTEVERSITGSGAAVLLSAPEPAEPVAGQAKVADLLRNGYARRSLCVWAMGFTASIAGYGIANWMPTLYTTVYKLPLQQALRYGLATNVAGLAGALLAVMLIDRIGRRWSFIIGFGGGSLPLLYLAAAGPLREALVAVILSAVSFGFLSFVLGGLYVYAPELYPTRMRAMGAGTASAWLRLGSICGPIVVGAILPSFGLRSVFLLFGTASAVGAAVMLLLGLETRGKTLEEISKN